MSTTYYVSPLGRDANTGGTPTTALQTINAALGVAMEGDTIMLAPGDYPENVSIRTPGLRFMSTHPTERPRVRLVDISAAANEFDGIAFGLPDSVSYLVRLNRGAHETVFVGCFFDAHDIEICRPLLWRVPSTKPFGEDAASRCVVRKCEFARGRMIAMLDLFGDDNLVEDCLIRDSANVDWIRCHGRRNTVRGCTFHTSYQVEGGNHPDFFQCFSDPQSDGKGWGSYGHVIEGNEVYDCPNMQLTQLSNMGRLPRDQHGSITFRNNLFVGIGLQASCTIPDVHYLNNTFIRCNTVNEGPVLSFGKRGYEGAEVGSGWIEAGESYRVVSESGEGTVTYNGETLNRRSQFYGAPGVTDYEVTGDAKVVAFPLTFAHGARAVGNIFLHCGSPKRGTSGWYAVDPELRDVEFDFNYVGKLGPAGEPYQPVKEGALPPGSEGWTQEDAYRFCEVHGVNGGDPGMEEFGGGNFRLRRDSRLASAGPLVGPALDFFENSRRVPTSIGHHDPLAGVVDPPTEPTEPPVKPEDPLLMVVVTNIYASGKATTETFLPPEFGGLGALKEAAV